MFRSRQVFAAALAAMLLVFATGAPLAMAHGGPPSFVTQAGSGGSNGNGSHGPGSGFTPPGQTISQAVYQALSSGETGTALANAVHQVIQSLMPNAKGITVAEAVYQNVTSQVYGQGGGSPFADMGNASWATPYVSSLYAAGVINGTSAHSFSPNQAVTSAQVLTMIGRLLARSPSTQGAPRQARLAPPSAAQAQFLAEAPTYAQTAIQAAIQNGTLNGVQGLTNPNATVTRAQAVALIINALGIGSVAATQEAAQISLTGTAPSWAHGALALAIQIGLLRGSGGDLLANQVLTRAQMAALLTRMAEFETISLHSQS
ncbi:MAG: S-layer homology domain-containing protein [Sulfobacillus sp.]